jgi:E-phenylitaconyl-CoA hydratase
MSSNIDFQVTDSGVATITLNRPDKMNAITMEMYDEISARFREIDSDRSIRVGIVTGAGERAFSAGADLIKVHATAEGGLPPWQPLRATRFDWGLEVQKPLIAAVEGYCLAGGLELALFCDIRVAGDGSRFGTPEVKWNLLHGYGAQVLPRIVGQSNALYMMLTGLFLEADRAERMGLVQEVVPAGTSYTRACELAELIAANGPVALAMTKELVARGRDTSIVDGLRMYKEFSARVHESDDLKTGTQAFADKAKPTFQGS